MRKEAQSGSTMTSDQARDLLKKLGPDVPEAVQTLNNKSNGAELFIACIASAFLGLGGTLLVLAVMNGGDITNSNEIMKMQAEIDALTRRVNAQAECSSLSDVSLPIIVAGSQESLDAQLKELGLTIGISEGLTSTREPAPGANIPRP